MKAHNKFYRLIVNAVKILRLCFIAFVALLLLPAAAADNPWPSRLITLVIPFPPGGAVDVIGRMIAGKASKELEQRVIVENRPGANGSIGSEFVARAAPDGYTLVVSNIATHAINQLINRHVRYDARKDFTHIALFARTSNVLLASQAFKGRTLADVIEHSRRVPRSLNFALTGYGSSGHMSMELLKQAAGIDFNEVVYKGDSAAINDMLSGQVDLLFVNYAAALPLIRTGKLHPLAVTGAVRGAQLPDVPTMRELGFDVIVDTWMGLAAPAGLPPAISARLNRVVNDILSMPDIQDHLIAGGMTALPCTTEEASTYINNEVEKWSQVIRQGRF